MQSDSQLGEVPFTVNPLQRADNDKDNDKKTMMTRISELVSLKKNPSGGSTIPQTTEEDRFVHELAESVDLDSLKSQNKDVLVHGCRTFSPSESGSMSWPITKAIRSQKWVSFEERRDVVDFLVTSGQSSLEGAIVFAAWCGQVDLILHILNKYKTVDVNGRVPRDCRGVDGVGNGETVLHGALFVGQKELVKTLVQEYGADVNAPYDDLTYGKC
jgi:hypothetical protein